MPTILQAVGIDIPRYIEGQSVLPLVRGTNYEARDALFTERTSHTIYLPIRAVRTDRFKLVRCFGKILPFQLEEMKFSRTYASAPVYFFDSVPSPVPSDVALYDLAADPTEQNNLAGNGEFKEVRRRLDQRLYSWMRRTDDPLLSGPIATPYYLESLRELKRVGRSD